MFRKALSFILALVMCLSLASCGKDTDPAGNGGGAVSGAQEIDELEKYEPERYDTDTLTWDFNADNGLLSIHGEGPMRDYFDEDAEWAQYRDNILAVSLDDGITSVGSCAFYDFPVLTQVRLPDSVEVIDAYAFDYDIELRSITIPSSLRYVGERAFYNTLLWEPADLVFPEGCEYIGDYAFHSALKSGGIVSLPSTLEYLGSQSFTNSYLSDFVISEDNGSFCVKEHAIYTKNMKEIRMLAPVTEGLTEFRIPDGVEKIPAECFNVIHGIESIYIPASVTNISEGAFFSTFELKEIVVDEANQKYRSENGLLLSSDGTLLLAWPDGIEGGKLVIPNGVERIGDYLFYGRFDENCVVVLPEGLKEIGTMSLPYSMASLTLPASLETIDEYVFYDGLSVGDITYNGTAADWAKITTGDGNTALENAAIHMN